MYKPTYILWLVVTLIAVSCSSDGAVKSTAGGAKKAISTDTLESMQTKCDDDIYKLEEALRDTYKKKYRLEEDEENAYFGSLIFSKLLDLLNYKETGMNLISLADYGTGTNSTTSQSGSSSNDSSSGNSGNQTTSKDDDNVKEGKEYFLPKLAKVFISKDELCVSFKDELSKEGAGKTDMTIKKISIIEDNVYVAESIKIKSVTYDVQKVNDMIALYKLFKVGFEKDLDKSKDDSSDKDSDKKESTSSTSGGKTESGKTTI